MQYKSSKLNALVRIKTSEIPITCVVDIGVERCTRELIVQFPHIKHHLFEPVSSFTPEIEKNYSGIDYIIYKMALSDEANVLYCIVRALRKDGVPTHARLSAAPIVVDGEDVVSCSEVDVKRYEDVCENITNKNFLLKIDVDGTELRVLQGMGRHLQSASVVIIEATFTTVLQRMTYIADKGFVLVDIVDIVYYGNSLYQCDLVFVRRDLINDKLQPSIQEFRGDLWHRAAVS